LDIDFSLVFYAKLTDKLDSLEWYPVFGYLSKLLEIQLDKIKKCRFSFSLAGNNE